MVKRLSEDDPNGLFERAKKDYNMVCTSRNAGGKLFWGPFGTPYNRRYCLPTGSKFDNDWIQLVSWKGSIGKDQLIRESQKNMLVKRLDKPPYPPMLRYAADGSVELTAEEDVTKFQEKKLSPRLEAMKERTLNTKKVYASPLDGPAPSTGRSGASTKRSRSVPLAAPSTSEWASTYAKSHHVPMGRFPASAMGAATMPPMHSELQALAWATGRTRRPKLNERQRKMWPENPPAGSRASYWSPL